MIALDTNVLRYLVCATSCGRRRPLAACWSRSRPSTSEHPGYACREVVVELVWVLERAYGFPRDRIAKILEELVATEGLVIEAADDVARAAFRYRAGGAGFSDLMIFAAAERSGAHPLYTFDQKAARLEGVELLR